MATLKVVFICQAVDRSDPILASTLGWIAAMRKRVHCLSVLTLRLGKHGLPEDVAVHKIQRGNRPASALQLYRQSWDLYRQGRLDCFFIYQGGAYPALLTPFKMLGARIFQWKAHPRRDWMTWLSSYLASNRIFTSLPSAFPYAVGTLRPLGQGVDTRLFRPRKKARRGSLVTVSRVSPVKRIEQMILAVAEGCRRFGAVWGLDIYGPVLNRVYREQLTTLAEERGVGDQVRFKGAVDHRFLPEILAHYRLFLNFSSTALDRSVVEAMACGLPVLSCNPCFDEILPGRLRSRLTTEPGNARQQAECIRDLLAQTEREEREMGRELRDIVRHHHSLDRLMDAMVQEMERAF